MSNKLSAEKIRSNPKYAELVSKRSGFAWSLTGLVLAIYYGFILIIAFMPQFLATPLSAGSVTTIGLPIGVGVILSAIVLTGIYVYRANGEFDELTKDLIEGSK
ncbi:DUF485 domain-containing protein [Telmatospirillum sp.]|uniref:DUF485 domain-containing protein n=1 Tax=Telmatospirillum sp. TaxID=2079197 RepID=UPI00283C0330|nr:DUF485 domain-containing protein [Telmatospirillum sp.]MDR3441254.1 DUF485 domain-containing protein [Telmatospirillum sp.]